jgi:hypothetical protein
MFLYKTFLLDFNCFRSSLSETSKVEVAGWGATTKFGREPADVLQFLSVNVTDFNTCKVSFTQLNIVPKNNHVGFLFLLPYTTEYWFCFFVFFGAK